MATQQVERRRTGTPRSHRAAELALDRARYDAERAFTGSRWKPAWSPAPWRPAGRSNSPIFAEAEQALETARQAWPTLPEPAAV
ncbi:hypothetical protein [Streptomyces sp. HUAS TT7]|uniref:hypothetical protein n=1 Tax=Streptomyces sp. HUAS TT7 TaxID=3447507 RepID=UPI003F6604B1